MCSSTSYLNNKMSLLLTTSMTWNNNVRTQVLALYRAKLRLSREMGYKLGTADRKHMTDVAKWRKKDLHRLVRRKTCGAILWSNVKYRYKYSNSEIEKSGSVWDQNVFLDHGFEMLRAMNAMREIWREEKIRREYGTHNLLPLYSDEVDLVCNSG